MSLGNSQLILMEISHVSVGAKTLQQSILGTKTSVLSVMKDVHAIIKDVPLVLSPSSSHTEETVIVLTTILFQTQNVNVYFLTTKNL